LRYKLLKRRLNACAHLQQGQERRCEARQVDEERLFD
jgi:hypothetical protein